MQILAGIILLGVLITFHELGHFLFAKWLGVRVLVFSVGFGPKLIGFKKGDTEYRLSAIPLGGYVRMFGESLEEELSEAEKKISFMHQVLWRKSLIAFAGPLFNFILPIILFFFLSIGAEKVLAPRVGTLAPNGVAEKAGLKPGDLITEVSGKPVQTFTEVADIIATHADKNLALTVERKNLSGELEKINVVVQPEAKASNNPLEKDKVGRIGIMPAIELPYVAVSEDSPLFLAGLRDLDEIKRIDGEEITSMSSMLVAISHLKAQAKIDILRTDISSKEQKMVTIALPSHLAFHKHPKPLIEKNSIPHEALASEVQKKVVQTKSIFSHEQEEWSRHFGVASANGLIVKITKDSLADKLGLALKDRIVSIDGEKIITSFQLQQALLGGNASPHVLGVMKNNGTPLLAVFTVPSEILNQVDLDADALTIFGVEIPQVFRPGEMIERHIGPIDAIKRASLQTFDIAVMTVKSLWLMVKREVPASQLGGPIMLFDVAQQAAKKGLSYYIFIMCLLSVNLGLLNLLPIPALDGGHLLLFGIEAVQRKPLTVRTRAIATQIGIAILLLIMAFAIFNDLSRLFR